MGALEKKLCRSCRGAAWFASPGQPDRMCGQCNGHGFVWVEPAVGQGVKTPAVMKGQERLEVEGE